MRDGTVPYDGEVPEPDSSPAGRGSDLQEIDETGASLIRGGGA